MASGGIDLCMLPVPAATSVMMQNADVRDAIDLNDVWQDVGAAGTFTMGCMVARSDFVEEHPEAVDAFLTEYAEMCIRDRSMAEDRLGPERIQTAYAWRTVLDKGGIIIGGSDAPVEMVNPFHGLYAGVTRMTRAGEPEGGWYANQKVTREEALRAFTIWAAYGQFEEDLKGCV